MNASGLLKLLLLFSFISFSKAAVYAQTLRVQDSTSGEALEQVLIFSETPKVTAYTNGKGETDISAFRDSRLIEIRYLGYSTVRFTYTDLAVNNYLVRLIPNALNLSGVIVSANKRVQLSSEVPQRVITITPRQIQLFNPQTTADLLGNSGEVFIQKSQQAGGSPMIRGFATNRLLYSVDGVRMNTAIFRGGNLQNVISLDPFVMEKTEVFFGSGSVIYGSDAIGGVMSFQTLSPQLSLNDQPLVLANVLFRYSSANRENTAHADYNIGWKKWALRGSFSSFDFQDLRMGRFGPDAYLRPTYVQRIDSVDRIVTNTDPLVQSPSAYRQQNVMQKVLFKATKNLELSYALHYSATSEYARYDRLTRTRNNGLLRSAEWNYGPQRWTMHLFNLQYKTKTLLYNELQLRLAQQRFEESRIERDLNNNNRFTRAEKVDAWSLNLDLGKQIGEKHKLYYGLETVLNEVNSTGKQYNIASHGSTGANSRYPQSDWLSAGVYATYTYLFSESLSFQSGLRYNVYQIRAQFDTSFYPFPYTRTENKASSVSGSIGLVYQKSDKYVIGWSASRAFRAPNVDDMGKVFDSGDGILVVPNPSLKPEIAWNTEVSATFLPVKNLKLELAVYYTLLDNAMVRRDFTFNGSDSLMYNGEMSRVQAIRNAASAEVYGIQACFEWKINRFFTLQSKLNWQKGTEELDNGEKAWLRHAAPLFGVTHLYFRYERLILNVNAQYQAAAPYERLTGESRTSPWLFALDENGNPWSPAWYTLNVKLMYPVQEQISISAGLENITDQRYRPYTSGLSAAGRNVVLSVRGSF